MRILTCWLLSFHLLACWVDAEEGAPLARDATLIKSSPLTAPQSAPQGSIPADPAQYEFFERKVRPYLVHACYECHSGTKSSGGLRVDQRAALLAGGDSGPSIIPGDAKNSLLIQSITHQHADYQMPKDRPRLPDAVIADIITWVNEGAAMLDRSDKESPGDWSNVDWPSLLAIRRTWWSLQPPVRPALPDVTYRAWSQQPVDRFILAQLERAGFRPAGRATREAWLRRVHFAITGLPPTTEELTAFLADNGATAREHVVDQLLHSPHFGERWARHWMDLVRYAESYGHEQDYTIPYAWRYRDYLIHAFNSDVPYNHFVTEHLAGDLLPEPRRYPSGGVPQSVMATGFWYLHQATHAPVDPTQDEADRIDNQIDVFSKTFLALTVGCARCHDHKFDAISTEDYYSLAAFLRSSRQEIAKLDPDGSLTARLSAHMVAHDFAAPRLMTVLQSMTGKPRVGDYLLAAHRAPSTDPATTGAAASDRASTESALDPNLLQRWQQVVNDPAARRDGHPLQPWLAELDRWASPTTVPSKPAPPQDDSPICWQLTPSANAWFPSGHAFARGRTGPDWRITEQGLELIPSGIWHSGQFDTEFQGTLRSPTFTLDGDYLHLRVAGTAAQVRLIIARYGLREFNPLLFGETQFDVNTQGDFTWFTLHADIRRHRGRQAYFEFHDGGSGHIAVDRIVCSHAAQPPREVDSSQRATPDLSPQHLIARFDAQIATTIQDWMQQKPTDPSALLYWLTRHDLVDWGSGQSALRATLESVLALRDNRPCTAPIPALAMTEGTSEPTHILVRGDHRHLGAPVMRRMLEATDGSEPLTIPQGSGRLLWAESLTSDDNPLLHRVWVNRIWAHLFGRGLVATVDNFGALGQPPSHPELLDYLVFHLRDHHGSLKQMVRMLCLTEAFAMSSRISDDATEQKDPDNRLWHRFPLRRLESEIIRDNFLAVSGVLNRHPYGPSVPTYLSPYMGDPFWLTSRGIQSGPLDGHRRRSVYQEVRRNFLSPWMLTFDSTIPETTAGQRNTTNVPAQALALMNDPLVQGLATEWARREIATSHDREPTERIERLYLQAFSRPPRPEERERLLQFVREQAQAYGIPDIAQIDSTQLWSDVCHLLFMSQEFIYVP